MYAFQSSWIVLRGKYYADRKVIKAALGDVQDDKQSPFPSVKNRKKERERDTYRCGRKVWEREAECGSSLTGEIGGTASGETRQDERKELVLCTALFECLINTWSNLITNKSLDGDATVLSPPRSFNEHSVTRWLKANWKWWWQRRSSILSEMTKFHTLQGQWAKSST